jgi:hypothetical protein
MLSPPTFLHTLYAPPASGPDYDVPPMVVFSTRWRRLRTGRAEERYRRFPREPGCFTRARE